MSVPNFSLIDPDKDKWQGIFKKLNDNWKALQDYLAGYGSKVTLEQFDNLTSEIVPLANSYKLGQNMVTVFVNGVRQWKDSGFKEQAGGTSIQIPGIEQEDLVVVIISEGFNYMEETQTIMDHITEVKEDVDQALSDVNLRVAQAQELYNKIIAEKQELLLIYNDLTSIKSDVTLVVDMIFIWKRNEFLRFYQVKNDPASVGDDETIIDLTGGLKGIYFKQI